MITAATETNGTRAFVGRPKGSCYLCKVLRVVVIIITIIGMYNSIIDLRVVRVTTTEQNSTNYGLTGTDDGLCVYVYVWVVTCVYFSKWIVATNVRWVGVKARTHTRTYASRRGGNNSRVIVLVPMFADKTSNEQRCVRAGAAATDENIITRTNRYAMTKRYLQLLTFFRRKSARTITANHFDSRFHKWNNIDRTTKMFSIDQCVRSANVARRVSASAAECWLAFGERRWMVQWCPLPGGGVAGGLVLHCCCWGAGKDGWVLTRRMVGTRMGPRLFRQPTARQTPPAAGET